MTLTARDTLVAVATSTGGVTILASARGLSRFARRAAGIRHITAIALTPRSHAPVIAAPGALYLYLPTRGAGVPVREGTIQAASAGDDHVFFAVGTRIEVAALGSGFGAALAGAERSSVRERSGMGRPDARWPRTVTASPCTFSIGGPPRCAASPLRRPD